PAVPGYRQELAGSLNNLGYLLKDTGRLPEAETAYHEALALRKQLAADFPAVPNYRDDLANTMLHLAHFLLVRTEFLESRHFLEEAQPLHQAALHANPNDPAYRENWRANRHVFVMVCACLGDQAAAIQAADNLRDLGWDVPSDAYFAARVVAQC